MQALLNEREREREYLQQLLASGLDTVLAVRANFPGADKRNPFANFVVLEIMQELEKIGRFQFCDLRYEEAGLVFYLSLRKLPEEVKLCTIQLEEEHPLGRLVDIDVYSQSGAIEREILDFPPRRCFLCDRRAVLCVREGKHPQETVREWFIDQVISYLRKGDRTERMLRYLRFAIAVELGRARGYGCVRFTDSGSHDDMNTWTFFESTKAMVREIRAVNWNTRFTFRELRAIGIQIEERMLQATRGVNAQRGLLFFVLLILDAYLHTDSMEELSERIRENCSPLHEDFRTPVSTNGMKIYKAHGVTGARGMAMDGLREVIEVGIPFLLHHRNIDQLSLFWFSRIDDTTGIHRGGLENWRILQEAAKLAITDGMRAVQVDKRCVDNRISSGGIADLCAVTIILAWIQEEFLDGDQKKSGLRELKFQ